MRRLFVAVSAVPLLLAAPVGEAVLTSDNCYVNDNYGNSAYFDAQYFNAGCAASPPAGQANTRQKMTSVRGVSIN